ncbi:DNA polymerase III subunit beta [Agrobacterium tumefaciens]|uniref:DNA polymerase III subunit beta n=1 Tax=Agrobacterium tumefaciens TaxID=358 RepID=UPI0021D23D7D|nr:DNA polymerase III subunit beta [Agrobacterium tumefaciens]UXT96735.1 DNA polymerase III subunit beta [Agrobacterium tumefaciens]
MISQTTASKYVTVEAKELASALKLANSIIEVRNTIPILNDVRLNYGKKGLTVEATDLDLHATIHVDEVEGAGTWSLCVPARFLAAVASAAGTGWVHIEPSQVETKNEKTGATSIQYSAEIRVGVASYTVEAHAPEDYPTIAGEKAGMVERFTNGHFALALKKVSGCISTEETRYYLNGVNWASTPNGRRMAATDGHRLALCRYAANEDETAFSYIIPRKTVGVISQFLVNADVEIFSVSNGNQIINTVLEFKGPGLVLRSKLIDGTFPDVERVIPKEFAHRLEIRTDEMLPAIRQATAIGGWRGSAIRLHGVSGKLHVEVKNEELGTAKVSTSCDWPEDLAPIGVNSRYMIDMVKRCQGSVAMQLNGDGGPIALADQDPEMTRLLMPMRV